MQNEPPPDDPYFFFEEEHPWVLYYCLKEIDDMKDKGLPALPFDDSMWNTKKHKRIRNTEKHKRILPDWFYVKELEPKWNAKRTCRKD